MLNKFRLAKFNEVSVKKVLVYFTVFTVIGFIVLRIVFIPVGDYVGKMLTEQNPSTEGPGLFPAFILGLYFYGLPIAIFINYILVRQILWAVSKVKKFVINRVDLFISFVMLPPIIFLGFSFITSLPYTIEYFSWSTIRSFFSVSGLYSLLIFLALLTTFVVIEIIIWAGKKLFKLIASK